MHTFRLIYTIAVGTCSKTILVVSLTTALVNIHIYIPVAGLEAGLAVPFQSPFHSEGGPVAGDEKREGSASGNLEDGCMTAVSAAVPNHRAKKTRKMWLIHG